MSPASSADSGTANVTRSLLISSTYFPPQVGGISNMMAAVADSLGPGRVCCLTGVRSPGVPAYGERNDGPRIYRRPWAFAKSKPAQAVGWGLAMVEIMLRERPRAVQVATVYDGYLGLWLKRRLGLPYLVYVHGNEVLSVLRNPDESRTRSILRNADRVVAVSHYTADLAREAGASRVEVVHPGCDAERFRPTRPQPRTIDRLPGMSARGPVLVSVGNLVARKGHEYVLRCLPRLLGVAGDLVYLIVGDGPERRHLEALAGSLGLEEHVVFAGQVPGEILPEVYSMGDVFVLPSRAEPKSCDVEGFGLVFLEANACGLPVIAGRSGGIPDAVEDGVTGLLVDPTDAAAIGDAIARLLNDPDLARRMGKQGRKRVLREFRWADVGDRIHALVRDMVAETRV